MTNARETCIVEETLGRDLSLELDIFLADPSLWPKAIFETWQLAPGPLPSRFRSWGAVKLGVEWCESRNFTFSARQMAKHYRLHVPIIPYTPDDIASKGAVDVKSHSAVQVQNPISYMELYQKGLVVGNRALELMSERVEDMEAAGEEVPLALLTKLADYGVKLATSQAQIMAKGMFGAGRTNDDIEGFRAGSAPLPSERLGHHRIRNVDGVDRPVRDEGPADRAEYNEHARKQGSIELPSP